MGRAICESVISAHANEIYGGFPKFQEEIF